MSTPYTKVVLCRTQLEDALLTPGTTPEEQLALSQRLDRLINQTMQVRRGHFSSRKISARRKKLSCALP